MLARHLSLLRRTAKKSVDDGITDLAASIAFYAFFALFPLLLAVVAVAGHVLESAEAQARLYEIVGETFPGSDELLRSSITEVVRARGSMGLAAVLGLLWSASAGFGATGRAINRAMGTAVTRSLVKDKLRYVLLALAVSALLVAYVLLTSTLQLARLGETWATSLGLQVDAVTHLTARVTSFLVVLLVFALLYKGTPTVETRWRDVWRGALFAAVLTEIGKVGFLAYLTHVANLEAVFGSLSSIMVLLLWLYVSAIALIGGAEYNVVRAASKVSTPP